MKKQHYLLLLLSFALSLQAQKIPSKDVPKMVTIAFAKSHPTTTNETWTKVDANYEVKFLFSKKEKHLMYDAKGTLVFNESKIALSTLPAAIKQYLDAHYPEQKVDKIVQMTAMNSTVTYAVEVSDMSLTFDAKGAYLKSEKK
jgi:hypothetical protein